MPWEALDAVREEDMQVSVVSYTGLRLEICGSCSF